MTSPHTVNHPWWRYPLPMGQAAGLEDRLQGLLVVPTLCPPRQRRVEDARLAKHLRAQGRAPAVVGDRPRAWRLRRH